MLVGLAVLAGYLFGIPRLVYLVKEGPPTHPLTVVALFAAGLAILLSRSRRTGNASLVLAMPVAAIGIFRLAGGEFPWALGPFVRAATGNGFDVLSSVLAPDTAFTFLLLGTSIVLLRFRKVAAAQYAAASAALLPSMAMIAYFYGIPGFSGYMAFPTMLGTFGCAVAILLRTAHRDPLRALLSPHRAGRMARMQIVILCGCSISIGSIAVLSNPVAARPALSFESAAVGLVILIVIAASAISYERMDRSRRRADSALHSAAMRDHLTGLLNRRGFFCAGGSVLRRQSEKGEDTGILLLDVDHFKSINEGKGQQAGDTFLHQLASLISKMVRSTDVIGRLGSNEFGLILPGADAAKSLQIAEALRNAIPNLVRANSADLNPITASVGVSSMKESGNRIEDLISHADLALFLAKSEGRNRSKLYQPEDALQIAQNQELERSLVRALENNEIFAVYQPQVNLSTDRLVGVEALARWQHPTLGLVPPDKFIPRAEAAGLIGPIGSFILNAACSQLRRWQRAGHSDLSISVNVSPTQLIQPGFAEMVAETLQRNGILPEKLILEVTESIMMKSGGSGSRVLRELANTGIRIAIDDFGTGYSSLSYLRMLPCNYLKIDRSFVSDIPGNKDATAIARGVIGMGRSLGLRLVAEGIETQEQADFLRGLWCDEGQGYLYSKPMKAEEFEFWAKSRSQQISPIATTAGAREVAGAREIA